MKIKVTLLFFLVFFDQIYYGSVFYKTSPTPTCKEIVLKMISAIRNVEGLKYNLKITERTEGKFNYFSSSVKLNRNPRKLYLSTNGIEVLWMQGTRKGDALVKPNSFPYINLNLDPMGSLMREGQHHTINEMGFDYFGNIIAHTVLKAGDRFNDYFKLEGEEILNGRQCYKFSITNSDFKFIDYTVNKYETLITIARKFHVGEYMILENNKNVDGYRDVKPGQIIKIPTAYAKYVLIYVDKQTFLPTGSRIYDQVGLYEQYDYSNLILNPKFEEAEFTEDYKGYGF